MEHLKQKIDDVFMVIFFGMAIFFLSNFFMNTVEHHKTRSQLNAIQKMIELYHGEQMQILEKYK